MYTAVPVWYWVQYTLLLVCFCFLFCIDIDLYRPLPNYLLIHIDVEFSQWSRIDQYFFLRCFHFDICSYLWTVVFPTTVVLTSTVCVSFMRVFVLINKLTCLHYYYYYYYYLYFPAPDHHPKGHPVVWAAAHCGVHVQRRDQRLTGGHPEHPPGRRGPSGHNSHFSFLFMLQGEVSLSTLRLIIVHNDPAAHLDHCGRCRIRTRFLCPRSLVSHHISTSLLLLYSVQSLTNYLKSVNLLCLLIFQYISPVIHCYCYF